MPDTYSNVEDTNTSIWDSQDGADFLILSSSQPLTGELIVVQVEQYQPAESAELGGDAPCHVAARHAAGALTRTRDRTTTKPGGEQLYAHSYSTSFPTTL